MAQHPDSLNGGTRRNQRHKHTNNTRKDPSATWWFSEATGRHFVATGGTRRRHQATLMETAPLVQWPLVGAYRKLCRLYRLQRLLKHRFFLVLTLLLVLCTLTLDYQWTNKVDAPLGLERESLLEREPGSLFRDRESLFVNTTSSLKSNIGALEEDVVQNPVIDNKRSHPNISSDHDHFLQGVIQGHQQVLVDPKEAYKVSKKQSLDDLDKQVKVRRVNISIIMKQRIWNSTNMTFPFRNVNKNIALKDRPVGTISIHNKEKRIKSKTKHDIDGDNKVDTNESFSELFRSIEDFINKSIALQNRKPPMGRISDHNKEKQIESKTKHDIDGDNKEDVNESFSELFGSMEKPVRLIINSRFRSGSSFIGSFFQYNPRIHYLFEPLQFYPMPFTEFRQVYMERVAEVHLHELLNCSYFPLLADAVRFNKGGVDRISKWWAMSMCKSKDLVMRTSCPKNIHTMEKICASVPHKVIKEITLSNFTSLVPLMKSGVKVIHLVRDPRGQIGSLLKIYLKNTAENIVHYRWKLTELCADLRHTFHSVQETFRKDPSLVANYKLVRYEEIAMSPISEAIKLYLFAGIKLDARVMRLLETTTTVNSGGMLSVSRNSSTVPYAWIDQMPILLKQVAHVRCCDVLHMLGYPLIDPLAKFTPKDLQLHPIRLKLTEPYKPSCPFALKKAPSPFLVLT